MDLLLKYVIKYICLNETCIYNCWWSKAWSFEIVVCSWLVSTIWEKHFFFFSFFFFDSDIHALSFCLGFKNSCWQTWPYKLAVPGICRPAHPHVTLLSPHHHQVNHVIWFTYINNFSSLINLFMHVTIDHIYNYNTVVIQYILFIYG